MKLAVSNIAWRADEAEAAYRILADEGVHGVEVAPGILFADCPAPLDPPPASIHQAIRKAQAFGHRFVSMQAVHFGLAEAALFGGIEPRARFIGALRQAVDLCAALAIPNIVLGSPRNRVRPAELDPESAFDVAAEALLPLADHARARGVSIAIEANPACYGTNFMTRFEDALTLCDRIGDPAFGVNYDLGERLINGEADDISSDIAGSLAALRHVQISAPDLLPPDARRLHIPMLFDALRDKGYAGWTSIEMRRSPEALAVLAATTREIARLAARHGAG